MKKCRARKKKNMAPVRKMGGGLEKIPPCEKKKYGGDRWFESPWPIGELHRAGGAE